MWFRILILKFVFFKSLDGVLDIVICFCSFYGSLFGRPSFFAGALWQDCADTASRCSTTERLPLKRFKKNTGP